MRKTDLFPRGKAPTRLWAVGDRGLVARSDALEFCSLMRDESVDVAFLDPPFNLGKDYGVPSTLETSSEAAYEEYMAQVIKELTRVLKPGGAFFMYHLPVWGVRLSKHMNGLRFRHWIAIAMKNGFARGQYLYPAHYALLYYTKGKPAHFVRPKIAPQVCRHCGKLVRDYGGYLGIIEQQGLNLSDFWDDVHPLRHAASKHRSANQLPETITDRVVAIAGTEHSLLVDPFMGTGTSLVSAAKAGLHFAGSDISAHAVEIAVKRLRGTRKMLT